MDSKTRGIVSYLSFIGWLVAFFTKQENRDDFEVFHLKQAFGACILLAIPPISLIGIIFVIIGVINANSEEKKYLPILGEHFENWFSFIK